MAFNQTLKYGVLITLSVILNQAKGQYQDVFASLSSSQQIAPSESVDRIASYTDINIPLGPKAQVMRNHSYSCIDKPKSELERGLWIKLGSKLFQYKDKNILLLDSNKLVDVDFYPYNKALRKTVKALRSLEKRSEYARNIIQTLQHSNNKFTISLVNTRDSYTLFPLPNGRFGVLNNNAYAFQVLENESLVVDYAPFDQIGSGAEVRWGPEHKKITLAHELSHAYDANYGLVNDKLIHAYGEVMSAREIRALYHENMIRKEMNMELRKDANTGEALIWEGTPYTYPLPVSARH